MLHSREQRRGERTSKGSFHKCLVAINVARLLSIDHNLLGDVDHPVIHVVLDIVHHLLEDRLDIKPRKQLVAGTAWFRDEIDFGCSRSHSALPCSKRSVILLDTDLLFSSRPDGRLALSSKLVEATLSP